MGKIKLLLRSCDADIGKPALLLNLLRIVHALNAGKNSLLHSGNENDRKLKPLCRMESHHDHSVGLGVIVVNIGHERDFLKETGKARFLVLRFISYKVRDKLGDVFKPLRALFLVELQKAQIPGAFDKLLKKLVKMHIVRF